MLRESFSEIQAALREVDLSGLPAVDISVLRNVVVEPIEPYLRYLAYRCGFAANVRLGQFDNVYQEAVGGSPELLCDGTSCVLVILHLEAVSWDLARRFVRLSPQACEAEVGRVLDMVADIAAGLRRQTPAMVLWAGFETPVHPAFGIADRNRPSGQSSVIETLNRAVRERLRAHDNFYYLDFDACRARIGESGFKDLRYWHIGRAPYSRAALAEVALESFKFVRALLGKAKKCLVLDCDNVLWGGIVGEDGLGGIRLGKAHPGSAYYELQEEILNLHHRGVIVALCSKNNEADVLEVFREHPEMVLREEHVAAMRVNWQDKATNLRELAAELGIGLDSMVFVDDSEFEVELVRTILPEVEVLHLPESKSVGHRAALVAGGWFDVLAVSDEDRRRGEMYRAEASRKRLQAELPDMESYYRSLEMCLQIYAPEDFSIARVAQLTQKTNQFNLTTRRMSDEDIKRLTADGDHEVICLRLTDRFGDAGIVGVAILRYAGEEAAIETYLMSCRVLGRGVEDALLADCAARARRRGCNLLTGLYVASAKNAMVAEFYPTRGFRTLAAQGDVHRFRCDLAAGGPVEPGHFKRIDTDRPVPQLDTKETV